MRTGSVRMTKLDNSSWQERLCQNESFTWFQQMTKLGDSSWQENSYQNDSFASLSMYILGINAYHADASAAIFKDGVMIAATEEERFRRVKHWAGFPSEAVRFCLLEAGIGLADLDHIAIGRDPKAKFWKKIAFVLRYPAAGVAAVRSRAENARQVMQLDQEFALLEPGLDMALLGRKIHQVEHHRSHLAATV